MRWRIRVVLVVASWHVGSGVADGLWFTCALHSTAAAEELRLCDGVYTNLGCEREAEARLDRSIAGRNAWGGGNFDGKLGDLQQEALDGIGEEDTVQSGVSKRGSSDLGKPQQSWSSELPRAQVLNRTESFRALKDVEPAGLEDGSRNRKGAGSGRARRRAVVDKVMEPDGSVQMPPRGQPRQRSHISDNGMGHGKDLMIGKAPLIKSLQNLQVECKLPGCFPALALEEAIELCNSLEVNYKSCREKTETALAKVVRHNERTRREQQEERRHQLEREKLRQRAQKLALDKVRHQDGPRR